MSLCARVPQSPIRMIEIQFKVVAKMWRIWKGLSAQFDQ